MRLDPGLSRARPSPESATPVGNDDALNRVASEQFVPSSVDAPSISFPAQVISATETPPHGVVAASRAVGEHRFHEDAAVRSVTLMEVDAPIRLRMRGGAPLFSVKAAGAAQVLQDRLS